MKEVVYFAVVDAGADCHGDVWETHQAGSHATVQCQNCHDALPKHFDLGKGEFVGPMPVLKNSKLCLRCHLNLPSRRDDFPQIDPKEHLKDNPKRHDPEVCFTCHSPHSPKSGS